MQSETHCTIPPNYATTGCELLKVHLGYVIRYLCAQIML